VLEALWRYKAFDPAAGHHRDEIVSHEALQPTAGACRLSVTRSSLGPTAAELERSAAEGRRMETAVAKLEAWLAANAPPLRGLLNPPATADAVAAFEARTSLTLPPDARRLYALHDGEADGSDGIFGCQRWLPLSVVAEEVELIGSDGIVPFLRSGGGDLMHVRAGGGSDQRVLEWWHESPEDAKVVAESLEAWLSEFVARLHAGGYVYRPDELAALIDRREFGEG
jgi:hypothetical protein